MCFSVNFGNFFPYAEPATGSVLYKKGVFKHFANLTGKHLCWSLFFNEVAGLKPAFLLKRNSNTYA